MGLDELLASAPEGRRKPAEGSMDKILAARELGWSFKKIAAAYSEDHGTTSPDLIGRWVSEHEAK